MRRQWQLVGAQVLANAGSWMCVLMHKPAASFVFDFLWGVSFALWAAEFRRFRRDRKSRRTFVSRFHDSQRWYIDREPQWDYPTLKDALDAARLLGYLPEIRPLCCGRENQKNPH